MQFQKPPLIELVAELKWLVVPAASSSQEEFFSAFVKGAALTGWSASERIIPVNFPLLSTHPALRIRTLKETESQMLYQVGPGVFSANALPPYKTWESFRPFVEQGLDILLATRPREERDANFLSISLRYLDLFTRDFVGDLSIAEFVTDILGFRLELPEIFEREIKHGEQATPQLSFQIPLATGARMSLSIGEAVVGDKKGVLMNTEVTDQSGISPQRDRVLAVWESAHDVIRRTFLGLTPKLYSVMEPIKEPNELLS